MDPTTGLPVVDDNGIPVIETVGLEPNAVNAGVRVANFISNVIVLDFQRKNLKSAIVCTSESIQDYSENLAEFIDEYYVNDTLNQEIDKLSEVRSFEAAQDKAFKQEIRDVIDLKTEGANYVSTIRSTAKFHNRLKLIFNNGEDKLSAEQQIECNKYFEPANNKTHSLNDQEEEKYSVPSSFLDQKISSYELNQVNIAVKDYIKEVTPLLSRVKEKSK